MQFLRRLRDPVKRGEITLSVRIWKRPRVRAGGCYRLDDGFVVVDRITPIGLDDLTPELARRSGFSGLVELLKVAKHGAGENVCLVEFHYERCDRVGSSWRWISCYGPGAPRGGLTGGRAMLH